jgi:hypothetical protein
MKAAHSVFLGRCLNHLPSSLDSENQIAAEAEHVHFDDPAGSFTQAAWMQTVTGPIKAPSTPATPNKAPSAPATPLSVYGVISESPIEFRQTGFCTLAEKVILLL